MGAGPASPVTSCCSGVTEDTLPAKYPEDVQKVYNSDVFQIADQSFACEVAEKESSASLSLATSLLPEAGSATESENGVKDPICIAPHGVVAERPGQEDAMERAEAQEFLSRVMEGTGWATAGVAMETALPDGAAKTNAGAASSSSCISLEASVVNEAVQPSVGAQTICAAHDVASKAKKAVRGAKTKNKAVRDNEKTAGASYLPTPLLEGTKGPTEDSAGAKDSTQVKSPFGSVYVQREGRGVASYHFSDPGESYISYKKAKPGWILSNGEPFPKRVYFMDLQYSPAKRTLRARIDWSPNTTKQGHQRWEFEMVFNTPFSRISSGWIRMFPPGVGQFEKMARFGKDVEYRILKDGMHQTELENMEKARQFLM